MSEAKKIYDALQESGALTTLYASMKGVWEKDKKEFLKQYNENEEIINNPGVIDLDDIDVFPEDY